MKGKGFKLLAIIIFQLALSITPVKAPPASLKIVSPFDIEVKQEFGNAFRTYYETSFSEDIQIE